MNSLAAVVVVVAVAERNTSTYNIHAPSDLASTRSEPDGNANATPLVVYVYVQYIAIWTYLPCVAFLPACLAGLPAAVMGLGKYTVQYVVIFMVTQMAFWGGRILRKRIPHYVSPRGCRCSRSAPLHAGSRNKLVLDVFSRVRQERPSIPPSQKENFNPLPEHAHRTPECPHACIEGGRKRKGLILKVKIKIKKIHWEKAR